MMVHYLYVFFFFKQKTAYEMRISDWSSDVCSSDLINRGEYRADDGAIEVDNPITPKPPRPSNPGKGRLTVDGMWGTSTTRRLQQVLGTSQDGTVSSQNRDWRTEEHTSELQSLMRISYAVFCLKRKRLNTTQYILYHMRNIY